MSEADVDAVAENVTSLLMDDKLGRGNKPITGASAAVSYTHLTLPTKA